MKFYTADKVEITPGMLVWLDGNVSCVAWVCFRHEPCVMLKFMRRHGGSRMLGQFDDLDNGGLPERCYSTREAAIADSDYRRDAAQKAVDTYRIKGGRK